MLCFTLCFYIQAKSQPWLNLFFKFYKNLAFKEDSVSVAHTPCVRKYRFFVFCIDWKSGSGWDYYWGIPGGVWSERIIRRQLPKKGEKNSCLDKSWNPFGFLFRRCRRCHSYQSKWYYFWLKFPTLHTPYNPLLWLVLIVVFNISFKGRAESICEFCICYVWFVSSPLFCPYQALNICPSAKTKANNVCFLLFLIFMCMFFFVFQRMQGGLGIGGMFSTWEMSIFSQMNICLALGYARFVFKRGEFVIYLGDAFTCSHLDSDVWEIYAVMRFLIWILGRRKGKSKLNSREVQLR